MIGHDHSANAVYIIWKGDSVDFNTDWRTWNHCLCDGILFALAQTDHGQGTYGYSGDI